MVVSFCVFDFVDMVVSFGIGFVFCSILLTSFISTMLLSTKFTILIPSSLFIGIIRDLLFSFINNRGEPAPFITISVLFSFTSICKPLQLQASVISVLLIFSISNISQASPWTVATEKYNIFAFTSKIIRPLSESVCFLITSIFFENSL